MKRKKSKRNAWTTMERLMLARAKTQRLEVEVASLTANVISLRGEIEVEREYLYKASLALVELHEHLYAAVPNIFPTPRREDWVHYALALKGIPHVIRKHSAVIVDARVRHGRKVGMKE